MMETEYILKNGDSNAYEIMSRVALALKAKDVSRKTITQYYGEATSGTYSNLIAVSMDWLEEYGY